ncbi:hypothetical protein KC367_g1086 [Hortaea werneckii]|nr:hypothetical protein KC358_g10378 [Hortaea werneckii]KAI6821230.1 hypothetical protein KC350_g9637 [Hortaea werneckii]KAI6838544.1 hypothetical protein KC342_g4011 [Hortaea werneckii]KAI6919585.1 hypothetical protein KC348_g10596 [Hortaea werneckii]KAI6930392.1 hypothetical protein KC341_g10260 [Hortaea werneckii]
MQEAEDNSLPRTLDEVSQQAAGDLSNTPVLEYLCNGEVDEKEPATLIKRFWMAFLGFRQKGVCLYSVYAVLEPQHPLLKTPQAALLNKTSYSGMQDVTLIAKMERWALADNENGFARHIRDCFEWKGLTSDEYEDMVEQKLYAFNRATQNVLFKEAKRSQLT